MLESLLEAIVGDNRRRAAALIERHPALSAAPVSEARLYESAIEHWLYAGDTPLHLAAAGYRVEIARLLLNAHADPDASANHRRSAPLHYAADGYTVSPAWDADRQVAMIRCLLEAGAAIDVRDMNGATPLHRAVRTRCAGAVYCLLESGCDATAQNRSGSTPFHLAVQNTGRGGSGADIAKVAQRDIIAAFLERGISVRSLDGKGKSVADRAGSDWIKEMLRQVDR